MSLYSRIPLVILAFALCSFLQSGSVAQTEGYTVYFQSDRDGAPAIYKVTPSGAELVAGPDAQHPSVTADGSMVFYTKLVQTLWGKYWNVFFLRGGVEQKLSPNEIYDEMQPVVSRDGEFAAFVTLRSGNMEIVTLEVFPEYDDDLQYQVTNSPKPDEEPALARGDQWVYWTGRTGNWSYIFRQPGRGGAIERISEQGMIWEEHPSVSADNRYMVYAAVTRGEGASETQKRHTGDSKYPWMAGGGSTPPPAEEEEVSADEEDTSEAEETAGNEGAEGNSDIWIIDLVTRQRTRLTAEPSWEGNPCISADGRKIVFTSDRDGNLEIYMMNRDGTGLVRLTENEAADDFAAIS